MPPQMCRNGHLIDDPPMPSDGFTPSPLIEPDLCSRCREEGLVFQNKDSGHPDEDVKQLLLNAGA